MPVLEKLIAATTSGEAPLGDYKYRLSTEQYYKMSEAGIFGDDDKRVELIDGEVYFMEPPGPMDSRGGLRLFRLLDRVLGEEFFVTYEEPISIVDGTEPQPDLSIAKGPVSDYDEKHPVAGDLIVVIEISKSSLASDRKRKLGLYAYSGIPEFWIVNLVDKQVEVYSVPVGETYSETKIYKAGDNLPLSFAPGKSLPVAEFVP